jgi:hypothetical protein
MFVWGYIIWVANGMIAIDAKMKANATAHGVGKVFLCFGSTTCASTD